MAGGLPLGLGAEFGVGGEETAMTVWTRLAVLVARGRAIPLPTYP